MVVFLLLFMLIQESIFFLNANECMTRTEVLSLVQSMEQKYDIAIASLKAEQNAVIASLKAGQNAGIASLKAGQNAVISSMKAKHDTDISHLKTEINDLKDTRSEMNPESHLNDLYKQSNIAGMVHKKPNPSVPSDVIGRTYQKNKTKRYLLGNSVQEGGVAFSATIKVTRIDNLGIGQPIHFGNIISNLGNAFDANISIFRVPVQGWYVFSLTLMSLPNETQQLDVVKNNVHVFHCYSQGNEHNTASRTVVLHADMGDDIWVQTSIELYSTHVHGYEHTSFTGFLLYVD